MARRRLSFILVLSFVLSLVFPAGAAQSYSDTEGHWGQAAIARWSGYGVLNGYPDGTFAPDRPLTRAELATILSNALGLHEEGEASFRDVSPQAWYAPFILRSAAAVTAAAATVPAAKTSLLRKEPSRTRVTAAI